jgi:glycine betaine/proline transport system substrate-binding protein
MSFNAGNIGSMAALVDLDGLSHQDAATKWLADNEDTWRAMTGVGM